MSRDNQNNNSILCDQCEIPFAKGGVHRDKGEQRLHFCCYGCSFTHSVIGEKGEEGTASLFLLRLGFTAFLAMNVMLFSWVVYADHWHGFGIEEEVIPYVGMLLFVLSTPVIFLVGFPFLRNGIRELMSSHLSMDSLIALGTMAAYGYSTYEVFTGGDNIYFDTATMIIVLVTFGRYLEATAKVHSTQAIRKLLDVIPDEVRVLINGEENFVSAKDIPVGSILRILPGEYIPLDGTISDGRTSINEAILTGESVPVTRSKGDEVYAGTINIDGSITIQTITTPNETVHARIVRLMEEAQRTRSPLQKMVDKIAGIFIPIVITIAILTFTGWSFVTSFDVALMYALAVLVVACPCALGIGSPIAAAVSIGRSAANGILVKSAGAIERIGKTRVVFFDKTGTLTKGEFEVAYVESFNGENDFIGILASIEKNSTHPLSKGIVSYVHSNNAPLYDTRNTTNVPGLGVEGEVLTNGKWIKVFAGSYNFMEMNKLEYSGKIKPETLLSGLTLVYAGWNGKVRGIVGLRDTLHSTSRQTVETLQRMNINSILLSGDREEIVKLVSNEVGIQDARGNLLPQEKIEIIQKARKEFKPIMMVGDGINDAPSLAAADVGVTLASATDIAKESADVTILGPHLEKIPWLINLSKKTRKIISWNLIWAFGYNTIAIVLAAFGYLQPIIAAFAMIISSLMVIGNSMRLKSVKV